MSHKNNDRQGRWRNIIVSFRVSPGEDEMLERKVALSGKTKQDYIIDTLLDKTITALPSPFVIFNIRKELRRFIELYGSDLSPYDEDLKQWMLKLIQYFDGKEKAKANTDEEPRQ